LTEIFFEINTDIVDKFGEANLTSTDLLPNIHSALGLHFIWMELNLLLIAKNISLSIDPL